MPDVLTLGGWFDPLTADLARRIENFSEQHREKKIAAVVFDGPDALLPAQTRAILMAALRSIDFVAVLPAEEWAAFPVSAPVVEWRGQPQSRSFIDLVLSKSGTPS